MNSGVNILMATYNGEKYIKDQVESILRQSYKNWHLFIRDDGSADNTAVILSEYEKQDERIHIIKDELGNLRSVKNFSLLLNTVNNDNKYFMFSDQDDVWMPEKINDTLKAMIAVETIEGTEKPLLVYTNFTYVNKQLQTINKKKDFNPVKVKHLSFSNLLAQNPVYGCTMMINNKLRNVTGVIPHEAEHHDFWIALTATALGKVFYLNKRTMLYRQHEENISGNHDNNLFVKRLVRIVSKENIKDAGRKIIMAESFKKNYASALTSHQNKLIDDFINLPKQKSLSLLLRNIKHGVRRQTLLQTILFYCSIFFLKSKPQAS